MGCCGGGDTSIPDNPYEDALSNISKAKWNDYKSRYIPFENKWIADVTADPTARIRTVEGQTNANMEQQTSSMTNPQAINPNTGAFKSNQAMSKVGEATGEAVGEAGQSAKNMQVQGEEAAVALGRGDSTNAEISYGNLAQNASQNAINTAYTDFGNMASMSQGIGQAAGMGVSALSPLLGNETQAISH
jgi:hypothetical protein